MTSFSALIAAIQRGNDGHVEATIPEGWMQGRTTYGGLTAALSFEAALGVVDDIPVRAAQVAFIGPVAAECEFNATLLRRGRSAAFVNVDATVDGALAARTIFTFGAPRPSTFEFASLPMPSVSPPGDCPETTRTGTGPSHSQHFDMRLAGGGWIGTGHDEADMALWMRLRDPDAPATATTLLAMADGPPPAIGALFTERAPISSMIWTTEFLTDHIESGTEWFLLRSTAQNAKDGYSSQEMAMWNERGDPMMVGRQTVAIFT